jgi:hypothetical protein
MGSRIVVIGGWRAYALGALVLAVLLVLLFFVGAVILALAAVAAIALVAHRALRALGLIRSAPRFGPTPGAPGEVIEGRYRVVEHRRDSIPPTTP